MTNIRILKDLRRGKELERPRARVVMMGSNRCCMVESLAMKVLRFGNRMRDESGGILATEVLAKQHHCGGETVVRVFVPVHAGACADADDR